MPTSILNGMIGMAIGDALGVPVEGTSRGELARHPVVGMRDTDVEIFPAGGWSESTSMALVLVDCLSSGADIDGMFRGLVDWFRRTNYTAYNHILKIGDTVMQAIFRGLQGGSDGNFGNRDAIDNGSVVRSLPLIFYIQSEYGVDPMRFPQAIKLIHDVSALTHPNPECQMACGVAVAVASGLISGVDLASDVARGLRSAYEYYRKNEEFAAVLPKFQRLFDPGFHLLSVYEISSGDGAVETLEAAVWSLLNTNSFEECVLQAVNLGGDTDGIGALAGGFAGIFYTRRKIPALWLDTVARPDFIEQCCDRLYLSLVRSKMRDLAPFLPYLQNATSESICNWPKPKTDDEIRARMGGPDYVPEFLAFIKAFYKSNLACLDYMDVIRAKGLVLWTDTTDAAIENADLELALAVLTAYIRSERFRVGLWCDAVDRKIFYNILCRLTSLTEQTGKHRKVDE